ncbi:MAG: TetR/AcrR family transcriptional regulator [Anaeroplasma sp.]
MPPKIKITKETIINKALDILIREGEEALNARALAKELGCSTQPIFSNYKSMDEIKKYIKEKAMEIYKSFIDDGFKNPLPFKGIGLAYIDFATKYPNVFKFLFMSNTNFNYDNVKIDDEDTTKKIAGIISNNLGIEYDKALLVYLESWIFVHGIACMICTNTVRFPADIISSLLTDYYNGIKLKLGGLKNDSNKN